MSDASSETKALGLAIAGGAVITVLLNELLNKGVLSVGEVRAVLQKAQNGVVHFYGSEAGREAGRAITDLFTRFPEN
jgi:hypothetical protein